MTLGLGRPHGSAVLGQPLVVSFDLRLDAEDNVDSACIEAEVLQGDTRIDPGRVRTSITSSGPNAVLTVLTRTAIEEPVVTVHLKVGCSQNSSRRYVLLTELPPDVRGAATATAVPRVSDTPAALPLPSQGAAVQALPVQPRLAPAARARAVPPPAPRPGTAPAGKVQRQASMAKPGGRQPARTAAADKPRLQLEPAALAATPWAGLKTSGALSVAAKNPAHQGTPAAEAPGLRDAAAKNTALIAEVQAPWGPRGLVYTLLALLVAALAAIAYVWRRSHVLSTALPPAWWVEQNTPDPADAGEPPSGGGAHPAFTAHGTGHGPLRVSGAPLDVDIGALLPVAAQPSRQSHRIHPEDLADVQQHADFFVSLGQYAQAIEVLRAYIGDHPTGSPVAYLDLLQIYQSLGQQADYLRLGHVFEGLFNAVVPAPAAFKQTGSSLEDHPEVLQDIEAAWGTPDVLVLLEALVRRTPQAQAGPFALGAYRELLLLHAVALAESDAGLMPPRLDVADRHHGWASNFAPVQAPSTYPDALVPTLPLPTDRHSSGWDRIASGPADLASTFDLDIDLDLDLTWSGPDTRPSAPQTLSSHMGDFDLFDPAIEADIAPRSTRR